METVFRQFHRCHFQFRHPIFRPHRSTTYVEIVTDRAVWSVCQSVTLVSPAKTTEPIKMPFGLRTWVGPRNHVLDGARSPHGKGQFWGKGALTVKYKDFLP